jgi:hypothetical protein
MSETRKLAAILVADVGADEDRILARLRALRGDLYRPSHLRASRPDRQADRRWHRSCASGGATARIGQFAAKGVKPWVT